MPSTGTPAWNSAGATNGAPAAYTEDGPPDRMIGAGSLASRSWTDAVCGTISEYTLASRTRRAMSWAYWAPKSTTSTGRWVVVAGGGGVCVTCTGYRRGGTPRAVKSAARVLPPGGEKRSGRVGTDP